MSYTALLARTWNRKILFSVLLELTWQCNLNCFYCYNDKQSVLSQSLRLEQYLALLKKLKEMGTFNLTLTGGEPLLSPHFFPIGCAAREDGFVVRIKSNGHGLLPKIAQQLRDEINPFIVEISLHGSSPETHDRQTRVEGSFTRLLANLKGMKKVGLRVQLNSVLTSWNEHELSEMFALADSLAIPLQMDSQVTPRDNLQTDTLQILPSLQSVEQLLTLQYKRNQRQRPCLETEPAGIAAMASSVPDMDPPAVENYCGAGTASLTIDPLGNIYPCVQWRTPVGNLHHDSISSVWKNSSQLKEIRKTTRRVRKTVEDQGVKQGGFCPALSLLSAKTPYNIDSRTRHRVKIIKTLCGRDIEP